MCSFEKAILFIYLCTMSLCTNSVLFVFYVHVQFMICIFANFCAKAMVPLSTKLSLVPPIKCTHWPRRWNVLPDPTDDCPIQRNVRHVPDRKCPLYPSLWNVLPVPAYEMYSLSLPMKCNPCLCLWYVLPDPARQKCTQCPCPCTPKSSQRQY